MTTYDQNDDEEQASGAQNDEEQRSGAQVVGDTGAAGVARAPFGAEGGGAPSLEDAPVIDATHPGVMATGTEEADKAARERGEPNSQLNAEIARRDEQLAAQAEEPFDRQEARELIRKAVSPGATAEDRAAAEEAKARTPGLSFAQPGPTGVGETLYGVCPRHGLPLIEVNSASTNYQTIIACPQLDYRANNDQAGLSNPAPIVGVL